MESNRRESNGEINRSVMHLLHRASQCAGDLFTEEVDDDALTPRQFAVLLTISQEQGLSQTDLVARTGIDRSTLADIVRRMQNKKLICRSRCKQDARFYAVNLTDKGITALRSARPAVNEADARLLSALPKTKRKEFLNLLGKIVGAMSETNGKSAN